MTDRSRKFHILSYFLMILCIPMLLLGSPGKAWTEEARSVVLTMGASRVYTDIPAARTAAVSESLRFAVQQTAVGMIPFAGLTEKFERIADLLFSGYNDFITDYKVLREISTDKQYRVLVQVTVAADRLKEALADVGLALGAANLPKILLLIAEQPADADFLDYWWKTEKSYFRADAAAAAVKAALSAKDFPVMEEDMIPPGIYADLGLTAPLSDEQAIAVGRRVQADVVVVGDAVARESENRMGENIRTFQGTVTIRAIRVETGEPIARAVATQTSVGRDAGEGSGQSLAGAGKQAAETLAAQILAKWQDVLEKKEEITLHIQGKDILPYLVLFRNALEDIDGVTRQQTMEMTPDAAVLAVRVDGGSPQNLADALLVKTFATFSIHIHEVTGNTIGMELVAK